MHVSEVENWVFENFRRLIQTGDDPEVNKLFEEFLKQRNTNENKKDGKNADGT